MNVHNQWHRPRLAMTFAAQQITLPLAPSRERRRLQAYLVLIVLDGLALISGFGIADIAYSGHLGSAYGLPIAQLILPIYWTAGLALKAYSVQALVSRSFRWLHVTASLAASAVFVTFVAFMLKNSTFFSRGTTVLGFAFALALIIVARWAIGPVIRRMVGATAMNALVIDDGGSPVRVAHAYHIDARDHDLVADLNNPHMLDRLSLYMTNMDRVIISCPIERRHAWAMVLRSANVQGEIVDRDVDELGVLGARRGYQFGSLIVSVGPLGIKARIVKRLLDVSVSGLALVLLSPLFLVVTLAILFEDGRPFFFIQQRLGRGNTFFPTYKFRSMRATRSDHHGTQSTARDDNRVTRVGRIIRRLSIDELPQLVNVLRGDMSLVGPRPHAIGSQAGEKLFWEVDPRYWLRHSLKPGLTGLAQVRGLRGATECESDLANRLNADLEYLNDWSLWRDICILAGTLRVLIHDRAF